MNLEGKRIISLEELKEFNAKELYKISFKYKFFLRSSETSKEDFQKEFDEYLKKKLLLQLEKDYSLTANHIKISNKIKKVKINERRERSKK